MATICNRRPPAIGGLQGRVGLASLAVAGMLTVSARADIVTAFYLTDLLFKYEIKHLPDLDQRRGAASGILGLPGNGGMYCAPTATMNLLMYCGNHGFSEVWPGPGNWQLQSSYNVAGLNLLSLGIAMSTDAVGGSSGEGWFDGAKYWLSQSAPGKFTVTHYTATGDYGPNLTDLTKTALNGSIVSLGYGRYSPSAYQQGVPILVRNGGHVVTFAKSLRNGDDQTLWVRDPANPNDGMLFDQSTFGNRMIEVTDQTVIISPWSSGLKVLACLDYDATLWAKNAYIDQYLGIRPKAGYSWKSSGPDYLIQSYSPWSFGGLVATGETKYTLKGMSVIDAIIDPDQNAMLVITKAGGTAPELLQRVDLRKGVNEPIMALPGAKKLVYGKHRELYAVVGNQIEVLDPTLVEPVKQSKPAPFPVDAIAYDDKADELVLLGADARKIARWGHDLIGTPAIIDLPSQVVMGGKATLAIDPTDGEMLFMSDKSPLLVSVILEVIPCVKEISLPAIEYATTLDMDDMGHLFAAKGGKVYELTETATAGWQSLTNGVFDAFQPGAAFKVTKSRTNFDSSTMSGPAWNNIDPTQLDVVQDAPFIPDCETSPSNLEYGAAKPGAASIPHLAALDLPTLGLPTAIEITNATPGALPVLLLGVQQASLPFDGGTLHLVPAFVFQIPAPIPPTGTMTLSGTLPADPSLCGFTLYHQVIYFDPGAPGFYHTAQTNGLARTFGS